ncbi:hypothetical protein DPMN_187013 [Dreissena polymorpha]|uniref:Uncharacterized protein n=1 Tax=Dreissena polymorpha TaxID=45954 RepID=A0A9D4I735_DREPO|nr:hypothetical protein DPMN_187013 [Dreissena polymorpha]
MIGQSIKATKTIFKLIRDIIGTNLLTKFHEYRKINVASRVLTRKNAPPLVAMFLKQPKPFSNSSKIFGTNLLTKFQDDRKINLTSRVKNAPPPRWPYIIGMNLLTEFHEDRTINVASRVLIRFYYSHILPYKEKCPAPLQPCFSSKLLTRKNAPPPGGHVFQPPGIIFELVQDIDGMNILTKCHEDWTINVASRVKNAPPLGSHVFQANVTIIELIQDIIETNLLTKFHEDWTINVASRELTRQMLTAHDGRRTTDKKRSQKLTMSTLCSGELKTFVKMNFHVIFNVSDDTGRVGDTPNKYPKFHDYVARGGPSNGVTQAVM